MTESPKQMLMSIKDQLDQLAETTPQSVIRDRTPVSDLERKYGRSSSGATLIQSSKANRPNPGRRYSKAKQATRAFINRRELDPAATAFPQSMLEPMLRQAHLANYPFTLRCGFDQALTSDGAGAIATVISNSPVQVQNWTNMAAVFDEYRVLAFIVRFEPYWTVNCTFAPIASVIDRSDATALTGYGLAERYESHHKAMGKAQWTQSWFMSEPLESDFISTASPTANGWIKAYSSGNTASFTFGRYDVVLLVQFRGLGIN